MAAWLAPSDTDGERTLIVQDVPSGEARIERPVDATSSSSLLFNVDGTMLYATSGTSLERIPVEPDAATPAAGTETITLPDSGYRIVAASQDHTKLLLTRGEHAAGERAIWLNPDTGETREMSGQPAPMWAYGSPQRALRRSVPACPSTTPSTRSMSST